MRVGEICVVHARDSIMSRFESQAWSRVRQNVGWAVGSSVRVALLWHVVKARILNIRRAV